MKKTSEVYEHLYHYTDLKGLIGILKDQCLWATQYKYLNDQSEIELFAREIWPAIAEPAVLNEYAGYLFNNAKARNNFFTNEGDLDEIIKHDTRATIDSILKGFDEQIYICSFCGEVSDKNLQNHGKLSQWRGYGNDNGRFCIVFDTKKLEELNRKEFKKFSYMGLGLGDIVYSDEKVKFQEEFQEYIDALVKYVPTLTSTYISKTVRKRTAPAPYEQFLSALCRYKHFGFKEESEVRIYAHVTPEYAKKAEKRLEKQTEKNGKKQIIKLFSDIDEDLPITRIIIGPHSKKEENTRMLTEILKNRDIKLDISEIPFLD
ncbi:MAG: DUF2971 domain-containing protein [Alphaproteobacteria bacterium]|nr:DUF2971 domain-containing protein [Alphaproteobacteria bacterium]